MQMLLLRQFWVALFLLNYSTVSPLAAGPKDTPMEFVLEKTYDAKTGKGMPQL